MTADRRRTFLFHFFFGVLASAGAVGCLVSGFSLTVAHPRALGLWLVLYALLGSLTVSSHYFWLLIGSTAAALPFCFLYPPIRDQTLTLLQTVLEPLSLRLPCTFPSQFSADFPLGILGCLVSAAVTRALRGQRGAAFALPAIGLPVALCALTDSPPTALPLFLNLLVLSLLLLSRGVRRESHSQGARLILTAAVPAALCLGALLLLASPDRYAQQGDALRQRILGSLNQLPEAMLRQELSLPVFSPAGSKIDLAGLGAQEKQGIPAFTAKSRRGGTVYLRQQDYDCYTGKQWISAEGRNENFGGSGMMTDVVTIKTEQPRSAQLLPYFPVRPVTLEDGQLSNRDHRTEYAISCGSSNACPFPGSRYLALPEEAARGALSFLHQFPLPFSSTVEAAAAIGEAVSHCAEYGLDPSPMPEDEPDFALWFLQKGTVGYCTHFAAAAAVLLRSAGIPSRLVTGFKAELSPGQETAISSDNAHAWAEFYDYSTGCWHILEATPAAALPELHAEPVPPAEPSAPEDQDSAPAQCAGTAFLLALLVPALTFGQRLVRLLIRRRQQCRGTANARAIACWAEAVLLAERLQEQPPDALRSLTEKACFSSHCITPEELHCFSLYRSRCRDSLRKCPPHRRFIDQYIYCAY